MKFCAVFLFLSLSYSQPLFAMQSKSEHSASIDGKTPQTEENFAEANTPEQWKALVEERKAMASRHDMVNWGKLVPDDVIWIDDGGQFRTKQQMQQQIGPSNAAKLLGSEVEDFQVIDLGDIRVLVYRAIQHVSLNEIVST